MKSKNFLLSLFSLILLGCSSAQRIESLQKHSYREVDKKLLERPFSVQINDKIVSATEIGFVNKDTGFLIKKALYSEFGKWDNELYDEGRQHPILVWKDVQFFSPEDGLFTIYADGIEELGLMVGSIVILNRNGLDALESQEVKSKVINRIRELRKTKENNDKAFYKEYWTLVDPEKAKKLGY